MPTKSLKHRVYPVSEKMLRCFFKKKCFVCCVMSDGGMSCRLLRVCGAYMVKGCSLGDSSYPLGNRLEIATLQFERLCTLQ